jgi:hypothetical protein
MNRKITYLLLAGLLCCAGCAGRPEDSPGAAGQTVAPAAGTGDPAEAGLTETAGEPAAETSPSPTPTDPSGGQTAVMMYVCLQNSGSTLTVRTAPGADAKAAGALRHGDRVTVWGISGGWAAIDLDGARCYVKAEYLGEYQPAAHTESPAANPDASALAKVKSPVIKVYKARRTLELWDGKKHMADWPVALGFAPEGHKAQEGDGKTPEGSYYVCTRNANSSYYLSLGISYPNREDGIAGYDAGLIDKGQRDTILAAIKGGKCPPWNTKLGGAIMIHGGGSQNDWTAGCIAVENDVMDILWECCKMGTKIQIYP